MTNINRWDKLVYDHHLKEHRAKDWMEADQDTAPLDPSQMYELIDRVYHSDFGNRDGGNDMIEKLVDSPHFKLAAQSAARNTPRALDLVAATCDTLFYANTDVDTDEQVGDFSSLAARLSNTMAGDKFAKRVKDIQDGAAMAEDLLGMAGSGEGEDGDSDSLKERKELMDMIHTKRFKTIINLFGEFKKHINKVQRAKFIPNNHVICDVELGNNFEKLLADEFMMFLPELEHLGNLKYVSEELLQFKTGSEEQVGKGDVTVLVDVSGSMMDSFDRHKRIDYAVACALAIHHAVTSNGRKCTLRKFNDLTSKVTPVELLRAKATGGTSTTAALQSCSKSGPDEDVLIITDGEDWVPNKVVSSRLYGLGIAYAGTSGSPLDKVCDAFFEAKTIDDFKRLSEVVF